MADSLACPFGQSSDFVLASKNPPSCFNFYPSLENAAADADRANGLICNSCGHRFTAADTTEVCIHDGTARRCSACTKLTWPKTGEIYIPMTWADFVTAQRDCYLGDPPIQITAEKWHEALEVLPPEQYEDRGDFASFLMMEHYSGAYTSQYVARDLRDKATYWTKMVDSSDRSTWMTYESLATKKETNA